MTPKPPFEEQLDDWIEEGPTDAPRQVLDTVLATFPSIPQRRGVARIPWRSAPMSSIARLVAVLAIAIGLGTAAVLVALSPKSTGVGGSPSPSPAAVMASPSATTSATPASTPAATPAATPPATPAATPPATPATTPAPPAIAPCDPVKLAARITLWEGAAGHRIANVEVTNAASTPCTLQAVERPQLVDGRGSVLINGAAPASGDPILTVASGEVLKTLVQDGNYCGPAPAAPVTVAFVLTSGGRFVAMPVSPTDATVPPCNGPGSPADISMQPWAP